VTKCPNCSGDNPDTQRFCGECGTPLPAPARTRTIPGAGETAVLPATGLAPGGLFAQRYQTIEELGVGGMGKVYRVLDTKVGEEVALKVIKPEIASDKGVIDRFAAELKLARQIVHRNVARMFDLNEATGIPYITMEYVRGENLKRLIRKVGRLSPSQAVPIACQLCEGLAEAHRLGILHRDLKPQNVMIDEEGQAKILDFGLARLLAQASQDAGGSRSGTPAYVSPEQVRGLPSDARSDIYSLGVLMYEMLTGHTPFKAETVEALIDKHLHGVPEAPHAFNPGISADLSDLVMKCLAKEPAARYQTAEELGQALGCLTDIRKNLKERALRRAAIAAAAAIVVFGVAYAAYRILGLPESWKRSVAVLPIESTGLPEARGNLLSGLQRELTDRLYGLPNLRVVPDFTVNSYDLKGLPPLQIGKLLNVGYLVKITVEIKGETVGGKIYLIDAKTDTTDRPMSFTTDLSAYRALPNDIAVNTAQALGVVLSSRRLEKFSRRGTDNIEAYGLFLDGMRAIDEGGNVASVERAIQMLQRAVQIDPRYALGHWALGYAYEHLYYNSDKGGQADDLEKMYWHLNEASQLDPSLAVTNLGLGWYFFNKTDNARAFEYFQKALKLEPDNFLINRDCGAFLRSLGLYKQALPFLERAAELAPRDPLALTQMAQCWLFLGRCEKALDYTGRALSLRDSDPDANFMRTMILALLGRLDEADRQLMAMERFDLSNKRLPFLKETLTALRQGRDKPNAFINDVPAISPQGTYLYLALAMKDEALANIKKGIDAGFWHGMYLYPYPSLVKNPLYKEVRDDPRFQEILRRQKELYDKALKPFEKL
jgi:eukaryotic-like serine/threonine-protein kinase